MEAKYRTELQMFLDRYPDYYGCTWKHIAEDERPIVEGRLRGCLDCNGKNIECDNYVVRRRLTNVLHDVVGGKQ